MRLVLATAILFLTACGHVVGDFDFAQPHECDDAPAAEDQVDVRYLGSGGVWIGWQGDAILLGPSFSNPSILRAAAWRMAYDEGRINRALKKVKIENVRAILAGHSHYDHIGDFPIVARRVGVPIYVNASGKKMLHSERDLYSRTVEIEQGKVIPIGARIRVTPVVSAHAPQLCPWRWCVYAPGAVEKEWAKDSWTRHLLWSFKRGDVYAFDIELLDDAGKPRYRIYYNDSAAGSPAGQTTGDFDLAILTMAQWNYVRDYPRHLLEALRPRHVMVSHWDNFFRKDEGMARFVPSMSNESARRFLEVLDTWVAGEAAPVNEVCGARSQWQRWTMPVIGASMQFRPRPAAPDARPATTGGPE